MAKKIFLCTTAVLGLWNLLYIAVLSDSLITEYFLDRFFYWGYPQWGILYSSPRFFLWFNLIYLLFLAAGMVCAYFLRRNPVCSFIVAAFVTVLSLANLYVPYYNWNSQFKAYEDGARIPEGNWFLMTGSMQRYADQNMMMKLKGWWGRGDWPGGYAFWGDYRIWMQPDADTNDQGRRGFVLHGGTRQGSPWGINIGEEMLDFAMKTRGINAPLELNMRYRASSGDVSEEK